MSYTKYYVYKEKISTDGGASWTYTGNEAPSGDPIGQYSTLEECEATPTPPSPYANQYLTIVPRGNGSIKLSGSTLMSSYQYSTDNGSTWTTGDRNTIINMTTDNKIMFKGTATPYSYEGVGRFHTPTNTQFEVEGNPMSLLFGDNFIGQTDLTGKDWAFTYLFKDCATLINANKLALPAMTLSEWCYYGMFEGCTSLATVPELPATTLAEYCYYYMFEYCESMTIAPVLPATTLAEHCYDAMFLGCTGLTTSPILSATTLVQGCYDFMFYYCTSLALITCLATSMVSGCLVNWTDYVASNGTFYKNHSMPASEWAGKVPSNWTITDYTG